MAGSKLHLVTFAALLLAGLSLATARSASRLSFDEQVAHVHQRRLHTQKCPKKTNVRAYNCELIEKAPENALPGRISECFTACETDGTGGVPETITITPVVNNPNCRPLTPIPSASVTKYYSVCLEYSCGPSQTCGVPLSTNDTFTHTIPAQALIDGFVTLQVYDPDLYNTNACPGGANFTNGVTSCGACDPKDPKCAVFPGCGFPRSAQLIPGRFSCGLCNVKIPLDLPKCPPDFRGGAPPNSPPPPPPYIAPTPEPTPEPTPAPTPPSTTNATCVCPPGYQLDYGHPGLCTLD